MVKRLTPEIFRARIDVRGPDGCHYYIGPGTRTRDGHIRISVGGRKEYAHRYAYYIAYGVWPYIACHRCDEPRCVRSDHIYNGTPQSNVRDRDERQRRRPPLRPDHWSSRLTQQDIDELIKAKAMGIRATVLAETLGVSAETVRSVWRRAVVEAVVEAAA